MLLTSISPHVIIDDDKTYTRYVRDKNTCRDSSGSNFDVDVSSAITERGRRNDDAASRRVTSASGDR